MAFDEKMRWYAFWILDMLRGKPVRNYYDKIKDSWKNGSSQIETEQKITNLIQHAIRTTEFYRDFSADSKLADLPIVNKEIFKKNFEQFLSSEFRDAKDNRTMYTSGSTGTPMKMIQNKDKINHNTAAGIFLGKAAGYSIGMKEAFWRVWVNNVRKSKWRLFQENLIMLDSSSLSEEALERVLQIISQKKVKCIVGYSSALGELSRYLSEHQSDGESISDKQRSSGIFHSFKDSGNKPYAVEIIIPISETMPDPVRRTLEKQFNCKVRAWYSNEENGIMGLQNLHNNGYRIDTESYYYEILKMDCDEPAEDGELGRIVITDLYNYAFPILRYDNGDTAIACHKTQNGRNKLYLKELYGRRSDLIYDSNGNALSPYIITNNMWDISGMKQFRFIQETVSEYTIWLNGNPDFIDVEEVRSRISKYLGANATLKIEFVDEIPVLASGKRKYIENRCEFYESKKGFCG